MLNESRVKPSDKTVGCAVITSNRGPRMPLQRMTHAQIKEIYDRVSDPKGLLYHIAHARN